MNLFIFRTKTSQSQTSILPWESISSFLSQKRALENMRSAMAGEGKMPRTDLATLSGYKLANSTA